MKFLALYFLPKSWRKVFKVANNQQRPDCIWLVTLSVSTSTENTSFRRLVTAGLNEASNTPDRIAARETT